MSKDHLFIIFISANSIELSNSKKNEKFLN